jgi:F1F0 ATPase subunit 2
MIQALAIGLAAGALIGAAHFGSLWWSVALVRDRKPLRGFAVQALRFVALVLALGLIARRDAAAFLAAALGLLAARGVLTRRFGRIA